jgi:iron complex transport system ATP-binding protein
MVEADKISFNVGNKSLLRHFSYRFEPGKCYMICGPNGAGKSTLLKLLSLELIPAGGTINYNGEPVQYKQKKDYATHRAVLSQMTEIGFPLSVEEIVMMGRYPHFDVNPSKSDMHICDAVMEALDVQELRLRNYLTLSGGEKQRVQFARVLAQIWEQPSRGCRILLLDEPISSLDLRHQFDFIKHMKQFLDKNTIVIAIIHDLNIVLNYADEVLLMHNAQLFSAGMPGDVLSEKNISSVFGIDASLHQLEKIKLLWKKS